MMAGPFNVNSFLDERIQIQIGIIKKILNKIYLDDFDIIQIFFKKKFKKKEDEAPPC